MGIFIFNTENMLLNRNKQSLSTELILCKKQEL